MSSHELDGTDWLIVQQLQADARLSFNELARRVHMSPPAVAERVRRLEDRGVITGYSARIDAAAAGQPLTAFIRLRCRPGTCLLRTTSADDYPEVVEIHKLSGEHCTLLRTRTTSLTHFEGLLERLGEHGDLRTDIVLSTQYESRPISATTSARTVHHSAGWTAAKAAGPRAPETDDAADPNRDSVDAPRKVDR